MRRNHRRMVGVCLAIVLAAPVVASAESRHSKNDALFSAQQYVGWIDYLASDELEGRGTGQEGIDKAAEYIASVWRDFGVEPAGDDNSFFQNFELALDSRMDEATRLSIGTKGRLTRKPAELGEDFVAMPFSADGVFSGDVVFAGYGIANDDVGYNDYAGIDVEGKVVLILRRGPEFGVFGFRDISFRAKAAAALSRGAAALMIVNRNGDGELYGFQHSGRGGDYGLPIVHITPDLADKMLNAADVPDIRALQKQIEDKEGPTSAALEGVSVRGRVEIEPIYSDVRNVVGMIPGTGPQKDEIIVLGAHYDHLGIRNKDKPSFDPSRDISNGADDNASGTAMLMQLAKAYTQGEAPNRSLVLIAFTGEELGLLGSEHFAADPTVNLDNAITMLNFDMVGRLKNDMLEIGGMRTGDRFESMIEDLSMPYGFDIRDGGGGRGPSDHTHFYQRDIPVMFFFTGLHKQYHRPEDDTPLINQAGAMRIARFVCDVIDTIDVNPEAPAFKKDTRRARIGRQDESSSEGDRRERAQRRADAPTGERVQLGVVPIPTNDGTGLVVESVTDGTPASAAGLRPGDRITQLGDTKIGTLGEAVAAIGKIKMGDATTIRIVRGGTELTLDVQFGEKPEGKAKTTPQAKAEAKQPERRPKPDTHPGEAVSPNGAIVECLMEITRSNEKLRTPDSVSMKSTPDRIELEATITSRLTDLAEAGALIQEIETAIKRYPIEHGLPYQFDYSIESKLGSRRGTFVVTIAVDRSGAGNAHGDARSNAHGNERGKGHAHSIHRN